MNCLRSGLIDSDDAQNLFERRLSRSHPLQAVLPHRLHSLLDGDLLQVARSQFLHNSIAEHLIYLEHFSDGITSAETGIMTLLTTSAFAKLRIVGKAGWQKL